MPKALNVQKGVIYTIIMGWYQMACTDGYKFRAGFLDHMAMLQNKMGKMKKYLSIT